MEVVAFSSRLSIQFFWDYMKVEGEGSTLISQRRGTNHPITLRHIPEAGILSIATVRTSNFASMSRTGASGLQIFVFVVVTNRM
jgi:hypothetical protein